jgi:hypothetical protein
MNFATVDQQAENRPCPIAGTITEVVKTWTKGGKSYVKVKMADNSGKMHNVTLHGVAQAQMGPGNYNVGWWRMTTGQFAGTVCYYADAQPQPGQTPNYNAAAEVTAYGYQGDGPSPAPQAPQNAPQQPQYQQPAPQAQYTPKDACIVRQCALKAAAETMGDSAALSIHEVVTRLIDIAAPCAEWALTGQVPQAGYPAGAMDEQGPPPTGDDIPF